MYRDLCFLSLFRLLEKHMCFEPIHVNYYNLQPFCKNCIVNGLINSIASPDLETLPTSAGPRLIVSSYWGCVRHPNDVGTLVKHAACAMAAGVYKI